MSKEGIEYPIEEELEEYMQLCKKLQQENRQLKDNWNKLRKYLEDYNSLCHFFENDYNHEDCTHKIIDKMLELEERQ